jgi:hypothetical protein
LLPRLTRDAFDQQGHALFADEDFAGFARWGLEW